MANKKTGKANIKKELIKEVLAALSVFFGITYVIPVAIILIKKDKFVRFYAFQAMLFFAVFVIVQWLSHLLARMIFSSLGYSVPFVPVVSASTFIVWILMIYKAWMGDIFKLPFIGKYANKLLKNF